MRFPAQCTQRRHSPNLARVRVDYEPNAPRLLINLDREKAASLGIQPRAVGNVLSIMFGSSKATTYIKAGQEYNVILQTELDQAKDALDERKVIDRAKGVLMKAKKFTEEEAYQLMRKTAMNENKKIVDIAQSVITAAELFK